MKQKSLNKLLLFCFVLALTAILLPAISSAKKQKSKIPVAWHKTSIVIKKAKETIKIGYPKGWAILDKDLSLQGGKMFYYNHYWFESNRSKKGWASVNIRWINTPGWQTDKWPIDEFLKDKDCGIPKCERRNYKTYPSTYIDDSCKKTTKYPRMQEGSCGSFIKEISVSGGPGYLFLNSKEDVSDDKNLMQTYLLFQKGKRIYYMEFSANEEEFSYFGKFFNVFIDNFKAYSSKLEN